MTDATILCPKCHSDIPLTESLAAPLLAVTRRDYERKIAEKDRYIAGREAALRDQQEAVEKAKSEIDQQIADTVRHERKRIAAEESERAKRIVAADLELKTRELTELQGVLKARDEKLAEAQRAQSGLDPQATRTR